MSFSFSSTLSSHPLIIPVSIATVTTLAFTTWWYRQKLSNKSITSTSSSTSSILLDPSLPTRRVWRVIPHAGSLTNLQETIESRPILDVNIQKCRCIVQVHCIGLNMADIFAIQGLYSAAPQGSFIPGLEFSGIIVAIQHGIACTCRNTSSSTSTSTSTSTTTSTSTSTPTSASTSPSPLPSTSTSHPFSIGDRIGGVTRFGAYTDYIDVDMSHITHLPAGYDMIHGAAWMVTRLTAWYGMHRLAHVARDEVILIHSAAGGVGLAAINFAHAHGMHIITTIGDASKATILHDMGIPHERIIIRTKGKHFGAQLDHALRTIPSKDGVSRKIDVVMDSVLGEYYRPALSRLAPCGRYVIFGAASFSSPTDRPSYITLATRFFSHLYNFTDPMSLIATNHTLIGFNLIWLFHRIDEMSNMIHEMSNVMLHEGGMPYIGCEYEWEHIPEALRYLQSGKSIGKIVIHVRHSS